MPEGRQAELNAAVDDPWEQASKETLVIRDDKRTVNQLPDLMFAVSQFCHFYPGEFRDGEIGWCRFWLLYNEIPRLGAVYRWNTTEAVKTGVGFWEGGDEARRTLRKIHNDDLKLATGER